MQFASLVEKLSGVQVSWISFLDRSLSCAFVISPKSIEGVSLQGALLGDVPVEKGLTIVAFFQFPQNCEGNQFCEFMKNAIGANATMRLRSSISSFSQFTFAAGVANIKLGDGLTLSEAGIEFKIGSENSIGLVATLKLVEPKLTFMGAILLGTRNGNVNGRDMEEGFRDRMVSVLKRPYQCYKIRRRSSTRTGQRDTNREDRQRERDRLQSVLRIRSH